MAWCLVKHRDNFTFTFIITTTKFVVGVAFQHHPIKTHLGVEVKLLRSLQEIQLDFVEEAKA
jgi:hypothetical protein